MRRLALVAVLLALALPVAGCLKSKDTIVLKKDGSGTIESIYEVDMKSTRDLVGMVMMAFGAGDPAEVAKMDDTELANYEHPEWYRSAARKVEGYTLESVSQTLSGEAGADDRRRITKVSAAFDSLTSAGKADAMPTVISLSRVEPTEQTPKGAWKLVLKPAMAGMDPAATGGMNLADMLPALDAYLRDKLDMTITFTAPTKILETNGTKSEDGRTATLKVDYDRILEGNPADIALTVVFEGADDLALRSFSHVPDVMALTNRLMKKPPAPPQEAEAKKDADPKKDAEPKKDG